MSMNQKENNQARDIPPPPGGGSWMWDEVNLEWVSLDPAPETPAEQQVAAVAAAPETPSDVGTALQSDEE